MSRQQRTQNMAARQSAGDVPAPRVSVAWHAGTCPTCGYLITIGQRIAWVQGQQFQHARHTLMFATRTRAAA